MKTPDPWAEISPAAVGSSLSARRVDASHPYDFFWGRDIHGRRLLVLRYASEAAVADARPKLNGVEIIEPDRMEDERTAIIFALKQPEAAEIFHQLCLDIVGAARSCSSEKAALSAAIRRAWAWHSLLRTGGVGRLSEAEQQGLFGELLVLRRLISVHSASTALSFWRGPLDEPKDFVLGTAAIEVKTRQGGRPVVEITSEYQLDPTGFQNLLLAVVPVTPTAADTAGALSLDGMVAEVQGMLAGDGAALEQLEALLLAAGWSADAGYVEPLWLAGAPDWFGVTGEFPRIAATGLPAGVTGVRYHLLLDACAPFLVDKASDLGPLEKA
ncbi:PD-(D/E)XK motif protein [Mesorhizobium sp.]|uniref:PD-(D/E)XK motif protein n=1 Tax=Mesorhizobium sp. TaxID=1871066 RepID=UPI0025798FD0|nr:PD-(D/E)XK motif protein [Mesorhizobium sp.]